MRAALMMVLTLLLAGCAQPSDPVGAPGGYLSQGCQFGVCLAQEMPEVGLQPGAGPILTFAADGPPVRAFVATHDGWAWLRQDADGTQHLETVDRSTMELRRTTLATDAPVAADGLLFADDSLWFVANTEPPQLHRFQETIVETWELEAAVPARATGATAAHVLVQGGGFGREAWILDRMDGATHRMPVSNNTIQIAMRGDTVVHAVVREEDSMVQMTDLVSANAFNTWETPATVTGVWADETRIAVATRDASGDPAPMYLIDPFTHTAWNTELIAENPRFVHGMVHFETPQEGANPLLRTWVLESDGVTEGFFLPPPYRWDASDNGLWWLEEPKADYRFDEAPNPTEFSLMLMAPSTP